MSFFRKAKAPLWFAAGVAGFIGDVVTYLVSSFELAVGLHTGSSILH